MFTPLNSNKCIYKKNKKTYIHIRQDNQKFYTYKQSYCTTEIGFYCKFCSCKNISEGFKSDTPNAFKVLTVQIVVSGNTQMITQSIQSYTS